MAQKHEQLPASVPVPESALDAPPTVVDPAPDVAHGGDLPVGVQLAWRLEALVRSGALAPGERLPGVRELAAGVGVNVNTARSVYRRLENEGLALSIHGSGTYVAPTVRVSPALAQLAADAAEAARSQGIAPQELARTLYVAGGEEAGFELEDETHPEDLRLPETESDEAAARRTLRGQIARLEAELAAYPDASEPADEAGAHWPPEPHVADLGELESVRDSLLDRLKSARVHEERQGRRRGIARQRFEQIVRDPAAHKWESVSNQEMGEPGCAVFEVRPAWGPVGALMNWWRVKVSSGCP